MDKWSQWNRFVVISSTGIREGFYCFITSIYRFYFLWHDSYRRSIQYHPFGLLSILTLESRNTLHISIKGNDSIISFLDRLILSSDVYLYCLASNKQDCPSHFQVIQVNIIKRIDSRVLRRYDHEQSQCYIVLWTIRWYQVV